MLLSTNYQKIIFSLDLIHLTIDFELKMSKSDELMEDDEDDELIEEDDDDDNEFEEKLNVLKASIEENKYTYQNYVDIIDLTKKHGDLDNLRVYREKMSELFPLTESN
jgi:squamous cell carcinoma antigen recognized by T-cells 3